MIKTTILLFFIGLLSINPTAFCQKSYIATDTSYSSGVKMIGGSRIDNGQFITVIKAGIEQKFSPTDLSSYRIKGGNEFFSRNISDSINAKPVFLERNTGGKLSVYSYFEKGEETLFIEKDSILTELPREKGKLRELLVKKTDDYVWKADQQKVVGNNKSEILGFVSQYNKGENYRMNKFQYGLIAGYGSTAITLKSDDISFSNTPTKTLGFFLNTPIDITRYSIVTGAYLVFYKSEGTNSTRSFTSYEFHSTLEMTELNVPVLLRYTFPYRRSTPFINGGLTYSHTLKGNYEVTDNLDPDQNNVTIPTSLFSFVIGVGIDNYIKSSHIFSLELRMMKSVQDITTEKSRIDFLISFSL